MEGTCRKSSICKLTNRTLSSAFLLDILNIKATIWIFLIGRVLNNDSQTFYTILQCYIQVADLVMTCSKVLIIGLCQLGLAPANGI
jgi:hypothetical protein